MKPQYLYLLRQVLLNIRTAFPEIAKSETDTQLSIEEVMISLGDFKPEIHDSDALSSGLRQLKTSDIACKSAWALYKDYSINQTVSI